MKIVFSEDFIYTETAQSVVLILKNCAEHCNFCPAGKLVKFYNYVKLNSIFNYSVQMLKIYGDSTSPYVNTFLKKYRDLNPNANIELNVCANCAELFERDVYNHIICPFLDTYFESKPAKFLMPACGDYDVALAYALRKKKLYPNIPIEAVILDTANSELSFWDENKIQQFNEKLGLVEFN